MAPHFGEDGKTSHANWLRISPSGEHEPVSRDTAGVVLSEITQADLNTDAAEGTCAACWVRLSSLSVLFEVYF